MQGWQHRRAISCLGQQISLGGESLWGTVQERKVPKHAGKKMTSRYKHRIGVRAEICFDLSLEVRNPTLGILSALDNPLARTTEAATGERSQAESNHTSQFRVVLESGASASTGTLVGWASTALNSTPSSSPANASKT